jgi:hypothetical protein
MLKAIWFAYAAIVSGFAVAWLSGGGRPPLLVLGAVAGVLALTTSAWRSGRFGRLRIPELSNGRTIAVLPPAPARRASVRPTTARPQGADRLRVAELLDAFRPEDLQRLRSQDYRTAWHRREIDRCEALLQAGNSMPSFATAEVERSFDELLERASAFVSYHGENAEPDPVVGSGEWLIIRRNGASVVADPTDIEARAAHLHELGAAVANSYEDLRAAAMATASAR